eukprot:CAMPEP_0178914892 /NCGR_PEP_ID=MMETSP0786-20121207/11697_1 /TAXON_ID=186022 /ORGANISM="Thalassionema frauenfeldii, Strain CCMP 1798" /LENGTH=513 /DNA_ID=CAMNT_0020587889 /DNA_START=393 /DNA_END=1931 /DNA_ORIENTATION=+
MNAKLAREEPSRRPIPRPWLEKKLFNSADAPELLEETLIEDLMLQQADILLDKKATSNPIESLFHNIQWCKGFCSSPKQEYNQSAFEAQVRHKAAVERAKSSNTLAYSDSYDSNNQSIPQYQNPTDVRSWENEFSSPSDNSSFVRAPRPAEIYICQKKNAYASGAMPPPESMSCKNWHQSYLSPFSDKPPNLVLERGTSSTTTLTFDDEDSRVMSAELNSLSSSSRRFPVLPSFPSLPGGQRQRRWSISNGISKPRLQRSKTALPPVPRPGPVKSHQRASTSSSANTRHRRSQNSSEFDDDSLNRVASSDRECDSSIATDFSIDDEIDNESPIFPGLKDIDLRQAYYVPQDENSVYLAKCPLIDSPPSSSPDVSTLLSGWVAHSLGDKLLHKRKISQKHLAYLVVNENELDTVIHLKQPPSGITETRERSGESTSERDEDDIVITLPPGTRAQTVESACGRCVVLTAGSKIICTLLPVNVSSTQSVVQKNSNKYSRLRTRSSVAQHDAALHLW